MRERASNPEFGAYASLAEAVLNALSSACQKHRELGDKGRDTSVINQFGEQALKADLAAEQTVVKFLEKYVGENEIFLEVKGEETGTSILGVDGDKYFAVLDGLDGSSNYLKQDKWSYGTMLAIAEGDNPKYQDFKVAGVSLPEENWVLLAIKDSGVFVYNLDNQAYKKISPFNSTKYDETKILSDNYFPEAKKMLGKMQENWPRTGSTAASVAAIATGEQMKNPKYPAMNNKWQALVDVTRKGNLEQPVVYLIISELGGMVVDKDMNSVGPYTFKKWGQTEKTPIISAKSREIIENIFSKLKL